MPSLVFTLQPFIHRLPHDMGKVGIRSLIVCAKFWVGPPHNLQRSGVRDSSFLRVNGMERMGLEMVRQFCYLEM